MTIAFTYYAQVRNNYCFAYYGLLPEYVIQLRMLRPFLRKSFPDLNLFISCRDEFMYLLADEPDTIPFSQIKENKNKFAYIREVSTSLTPPHSMLQIIAESAPGLVIEVEPQPQTARRCLICPDGALPTKPFINVDRLKAYAAARGYVVKVAGSEIHPSQAIVDVRPVGASKFDLLNKADWVLGVENEFLFEAARRGIKTTLIPTGLGIDLYKKLCPGGEIAQL